MHKLQVLLKFHSLWKKAIAIFYQDWNGKMEKSTHDDQFYHLRMIKIKLLQNYIGQLLIEGPVNS